MEISKLICKFVHQKFIKDMYIHNKTFTPNYKLFLKEIYNTHPQGKGILKFDFWKIKFEDELLIAFELLTI